MAKETGALAAVAIKTLPRGKHADGGGLYLHVLDSGTRAWRMKYRHGGREKLLSFGVFPEVTLAEARHQRTTARALLREGTDPSAHKAGQRDTAKRTADAMFPKVPPTGWPRPSPHGHPRPTERLPTWWTPI